MIEIPPLKWKGFDRKLTAFFATRFPDWLPYGQYSEAEMALHILNHLDKPKNYLTQTQVILALRKRGFSVNGFVTITKENANECCA